MPSLLRRFWFLVVFSPLLALAPAARAHDPFVAEIRARAEADTLSLRLVFARSVAAHLAGLGSGPRVFYPPERFEADRAAFVAAAFGLVELAADGRPLAPSRVEVECVTDPDLDVAFTLVFPRPGPGSAARLRLSCPWLTRLPAFENYTATFVLHEGDALRAGPALLSLETPAVEFALAAAGAARSPVPPAAGVSAPAAAETPAVDGAGFFKLGVEHILTGYDHLLYLAALILGCARFRLIVGIVTAFTLSHSLTLALATLGFVSPPSALVEQAIAATIVFVAIENIWLRGREPRFRHAVAFAFGLIHGFGFAGLLADLGVGAADGPVVVPLLCFNLGVETGQLLVIACALPLLVWARRRPRFVAHGQPAASLGVAALGLFWFVQRL